ncbi:hypothetical protein [Citrobacter sp.]|uniref:hypothetical protein n=1 Tax=Citrobacter sp. TaxID=1896336 RepID=UPI002FCA883F
MTAAYQYNTDTGIISVDSEDMLSDVQKEWTDIYGTNLDLAAETPQGTMIGGEATNRIGLMKNNADIANMMNPNYSYSTYLDAVCAWLMPDGRGKNLSTTGTGVEVDGDPGTKIQAGFRVKNSTDDIFVVSEDVTIGASRKEMINIASQESGPVPLPQGTLEIVDAVIGWGGATVINSTAVVLGTKQLTDPQLKTLRNQSLFAMGLSATGAIQANLLAVDNVKSIKIEENMTGAAGLVNGITFTGPGIWVCVAGAATSADIANAIFAARQGACPYDYGTNNGTPVDSPNGTPVTDPYSQSVYRVKFTRAVEKDVYIRLKAKKGTSTASEIAVSRAIKDYADGLVDGEPGFVVGSSISAFEVAGAVCRQYPGLYVYSSLVAVVAKGAAAPSDSDYKTEVPLSPWEIGTLAIGNITVNLD